MKHVLKLTIEQKRVIQQIGLDQVFFDDINSVCRRAMFRKGLIKRTSAPYPYAVRLTKVGKIIYKRIMNKGYYGGRVEAFKGKLIYVN